MAIYPGVEGRDHTGAHALRLGNITDPFASHVQPQRGVPFGAAIATDFLNVPPAADADFWVESAAADATGALTLANTTMVTNTADGNVYSGRVLLTLSASLTASVVLVGTNILGQALTETIAITAGTTGTSVQGFATLSSATVSVAAASGTLTVGFNALEFRYPNYVPTVLSATLDADAAEFPAVDDVAQFTFTAAVPSGGIPRGFHVSSNFDATANFQVTYLVHGFYRPDTYLEANDSYPIAAFDL